MKNILIYNSGGGLGDSIQLFDLVTSLKTNFKDASLFYLGAHENHFQGSLKEYGIDIPTFEMNLKYFGFRWKHLFLAKKIFNQKSIDKFDLIIDLQSKIRNTLILKQIPSDNFYSSSLNYFFSTKKKNYVSTKNNLNMILDNIEDKFVKKELMRQRQEEIQKRKYSYFSRKNIVKEEETVKAKQFFDESSIKKTFKKNNEILEIIKLKNCGNTISINDSTSGSIKTSALDSSDKSSI